MNGPCRVFRPVASLLRVAAALLLSMGLVSATEVWAQLDDASIGDYVWLDQNGDGVQDAAENGISGVIVYLDLDDNGIRHPHEPFATTDAAGAYDFTGLAAGTYVVRIDRKSIPAGFDLTTANLPLTVVLAESQDYNNADFGYDDDPENASIGDYVWLDQNADAIQAATEPGISGITVFLDLNDSAALDPGEPYATTGADGAYDIAGLAASTYSVRVDETTVPTGYDLTTANLPLIVVLDESQDYNDADFGYDNDAENASIGDYVWLDQDGDGAQDAAEDGVPGITVFLDQNYNSVLDAGEPSATTNITGTYDITGLAAGTYSVQVDPTSVPVGYELTTANLPLTVVLAESQDYNNADFGYDGDPGNASIGDYVWLDRDGDGIQDAAETGLSDITVFLDLDGDTIFDASEPSSATDANGAYDITDLAAGSYSVCVDETTLPTGYDITTANVPLTVLLVEGQDYNDADFGYDDDPENASIGDYIWLDQNGDGIQDATEPGISGITVFLDLDNDGTPDGDEPLATTNVNGAYDITGLAAATYSVRVDAATIPTGYNLTTANVPLSVILTESHDYNDADFGYDDGPENASIGDYIWFDENGDGVQDGTESGLANIFVYLDLNGNTTPDPGEPFDITDVNGAYDISDLSAGTYSVRVDTTTLPSGYNLTTANVPLAVVLADNEDYNDADFGFEGYSLTLSLSGEGSVTVEPDQITYRYNQEVTLTAVADPGWEFAGWSGDLSGNTNPTTLAVPHDLFIIAVFTQDDYTLTVNTIGSGSVSKDPNQLTYHYGDEVILTATPDSGWGFAGWSEDLSGITNPATLIMDGHKTVTALFEWQHDLTVETLGTGSIVLEPPGGTYSHDTVVQVTAIPDPGWIFSHWSGDLTGTDNPAYVTLDRDKTIIASFTYLVYLPVVLDRWPPTPSVPSLNLIDNADGDGNYTISWSISSGAETYLLQEATTSDFSDAAIVYSGPSTTYGVSGRGAARYYYRVKARNIWTESDWSNARQADVLWEAEPNDEALQQANGPIVPNLVYYGTFPDGDDVNDYYYLDLYTSQRLKLWLRNIPTGQNYDLVLRDASLAVVGYSAQILNTDEYIDTVQKLPPGRYYVQVYHFSSGGSTQPYHLTFRLE